jgi:uncharacterized membrane protein YoaK (UPF0700 family)
MADPASIGAAKARLLPLMLTLSLTTGLIDAVSVLGLGKVFTANMTGNVVFLALALGGAPGFIPALYLTALVGFFTGAVIGGRLAIREIERPLRSWMVAAASIETTVLWVAALIAIAAYDRGQTTSGLAVYAIIAFTAAAMGFRNATIRRLQIPDMTTTVLTLTITGLASDSPIAGGANPNFGRRIASVIAMFVGAGAGALLVLGPGIAIALLLAGLLVLVGTLLCASQQL